MERTDLIVQAIFDAGADVASSEIQKNDDDVLSTLLKRETANPQLLGSCGEFMRSTDNAVHQFIPQH